MYTTIIHPLRNAFNLTCNDYCVLDTIYHLSKNNKYGGWCVQSQENIGEVLGLSRQTINKIIGNLIEKGLIEKGDLGFRTVDKWNELISNKDKINLSSNDLITIAADTLQGVKKVDSGCKESGQLGVKKVDSGCKESLHNNNINNNINNNNNILSKDNIEQSSTDLFYGNKEINDFQEFIKKIVTDLGLIYKKGKYERGRIKNILTGKDFGEICEKSNMTRQKFCENIIIASTKLDFWNGKIYNAETLYEYYAKIYNEVKAKKDSLNYNKNIGITTI